MTTLNRRGLAKALEECGFSYRDARTFVTVLINELTHELKTNGKLDLPFGTITLVAPKPQRAYRLGQIVQIYSKNRAHFRKKD